MPSNEVQTRNDPIFVEYFEPSGSLSEDMKTIAEWVDDDPESGYTVHQILFWRGNFDLGRGELGHHELYYSIDIVTAMGR